MCGRFVSTASPQVVADVFDAIVGPELEQVPVGPNWNVAPTTSVLGVVATGAERMVRPFRWGLVPSWTKALRGTPALINARAETLADKPSFRTSFRRHRLVVPMDGFYEWQAVTKPDGSVGKRPVFVHAADGHLLAAAGLWSAWRDPDRPGDDAWLHSCTIVTTAANATMAPVHDRMPVFLDSEAIEWWLDPTCEDTQVLQGLLVPAADALLVLHEVSSAVNSVRNRGEQLIAPV